MKYMCLVYIDETKFDSMSQDEIDALEDEALANDASVAKRGHLIRGQALDAVRSAVTIRVRDGKLSTTDGPFAETKEQLGGFIFIEADDIDQAVEIASAIPMARIGSIEVRPAMDLERKVRERSRS